MVPRRQGVSPARSMGWIGSAGGTEGPASESTPGGAFSSHKPAPIISSLTTELTAIRLRLRQRRTDRVCGTGATPSGARSPQAHSVALNDRHWCPSLSLVTPGLVREWVQAD